MKEYWSDSQLADLIRGVEKLKCGSWKQWNEWEENARKLHPIRYWIAEDGMSYLEDFVYFIPNKLHELKNYILNRFVTRSHTLTSSQLKPGRFHEYFDRLLYCSFDELVNFVEIDLAHMMVIFNDDNSKKYNNPKWNFRWRNREAGLDYLSWASSLDQIDDITDNSINHIDFNQAKYARWVKDAYIWWTEIRPNRKDPHEISGCDEYIDYIDSTYGSIFADHISDEDREKLRYYLDKAFEIEKSYEDEDTRYLKELIDFRMNLWT